MRGGEGLFSPAGTKSVPRGSRRRRGAVMPPDPEAEAGAQMFVPVTSQEVS